jgi:hypothetical protein
MQNVKKQKIASNTGASVRRYRERRGWAETVRDVLSKTRRCRGATTSRGRRGVAR